MGVRALTVEGPQEPLSAELTEAVSPKAMLVLAHGAGAGYQHNNLLGISAALAGHGVSSLRFNFPYMQAGRRRGDSVAVATAALAAGVAEAQAQGGGLPLFLGGHSFGGRMASHAVLGSDLDVRGLIFCSFPLHQPKKPGVERAAHLVDIALPMLFLSGTRDALAQADLLEEVVAGLGTRARLHWLATADHSYRILKRQRLPEPTVFEEMAGRVAAFVEEVCGRAQGS